MVNLELLGDTVKRTDTQIGEWVNVIGTVEGAITVRAEGGQKSKSKEVRIKAVILWSAGGIKLEEYESAVERRITSESATRKV